MKFSRIRALLLVALVFSGCGYTRHTVLPQNIKTIYIDTVQNQIQPDQIYAYQPGLEIEITNAIIRRIEIDGNLRIVPREQADAILEPRLIGFDQAGLRFTSLEAVEEYRLFIVLALQLLNAKTGEVIWQEPNFSGDAEYIVSQVRSVARQEASQRAIERLAKNVVDRIVEDW